MSKHELKELKSDPLTHLDDEAITALARHEALSGCFAVLPAVSVCYSRDGAGFKLCLKLAGIEVACATVDPTNPCQTLAGSVILAKASIKLCISGSCLTYEAQACVRATPFASWSCTQAKGNIVCF